MSLANEYPIADLSGRRALVTGASQGVGEAIAQSLAASGAHVIVSGRNEGNLQRVRSSIIKSGGSAECISADLMTREGCRRLATASGRVDILVNNAAETSHKTQSILTEDDALWNRQIQLHIKAPLALIQDLAPGMKARCSGAIVNISSIHAQYGIPGYSHYACTKAALDVMSKGAAMDLGPYGITVGVLALGATESPGFVSAASEAGGHEVFERRIPIGKINKAADIGALCVFLVSERGATLTGMVINVDGGTTAGRYSI